MNLSNISEIDKLNIVEKILFLEELWDKISSKNKEIPVPDSHITEMKKRLEKYEQNPGNLLTIRDIRVNIEKRVTGFFNCVRSLQKIKKILQDRKK